jgi:hypothetical protein
MQTLAVDPVRPLQRYPVKLDYINRMLDEDVRKEFRAVLLSALQNEHRMFAKRLLSNNRHWAGFDFDNDPRMYLITDGLNEYVNSGPRMEIINFLTYYYNRLEKSQALTSGDPKQAREAMKKKMKKLDEGPLPPSPPLPRLPRPSSLPPHMLSEDGGGRRRRRKTKKSKRRARKTRRRHK